MNTVSFTNRSTEVTPVRWSTPPPLDCPLERSRLFTGVSWTGRWANYTGADYWYPSWAADGHLYSGCGDGEVAGHRLLNMGFARIEGDDPLNLTFRYLGSMNIQDWQRTSAYPGSSLLKDGKWYLALEEGWNELTPGRLARFQGMLVGHNPAHAVGELGYPFATNPYWSDHSSHPLRLMQEGTIQALEDAPKGGFWGEEPGISRFRNVHFVDFGRNMQHSPDGMAYAVAHGSVGSKPAEWGNGDGVYLMRVPAEERSLVNAAEWSFYAGRDEHGKVIWTHSVSKAQPLLEWKDKLGLAHVVYNAPLKRYIMCISPLLQSDTMTASMTPERRFSAEGSLILEAPALTGPWKLLEYLKGFGPNAYCMAFPSKFISEDGRTAWLFCSANYTDFDHPGDPIGMKYACHVREVTFDIAVSTDGSPAGNDETTAQPGLAGALLANPEGGIPSMSASGQPGVTREGQLSALYQAVLNAGAPVFQLDLADGLSREFKPVVGLEEFYTVSQSGRIVNVSEPHLHDLSPLLPGVETTFYGSPAIPLRLQFDMNEAPSGAYALLVAFADTRTAECRSLLEVNVNGAVQSAVLLPAGYGRVKQGNWPDLETGRSSLVQVVFEARHYKQGLNEVSIRCAEGGMAVLDAVALVHLPVDSPARITQTITVDALALPASSATMVNVPAGGRAYLGPVLGGYAFQRQSTCVMSKASCRLVSTSQRARGTMSGDSRSDKKASI